MPPPDGAAEWPRGYVHGGWFPRDDAGDSDSDSDEALPVPPPPPPPPLVRVDWKDCCCCFLLVLLFCAVAVPFRGWLLLDDPSVLVMVNAPVATLILTRMNVLVMKSSPAPPLLPTCPAPALWSPPVCYEWEKPAAAMVLPGSSGFEDSSWWSDEQDSDYKAAKKCKPMNCYDSFVRNAARTCLVSSYNTIPLTPQSGDDPPPSLQHD